MSDYAVAAAALLAAHQSVLDAIEATAFPDVLPYLYVLRKDIKDAINRLDAAEHARLTAE